ncbi:MAG: hypothetical protein COS88_00765 [Chloroflexi bacterium CG07_land_8_20_14_0_80_51_10]|nr:MAG: hypothetical protein COS88_00765 [Chloroflexi bacterium CG07_land_8_20_14_0_80_51_10]
MTMQRYEWERIRIEYVQGRVNGDGIVERPTLEALAKEYDIPVPTIKSRSSREGWTEERNLFHTQLIQKSHEKALEQLAEKASQLDLQAFSVARATLALHGKQLIEGIQSGSMSLADRERLLRMCDTAYRLGRRAMGIGQTSD